MKLFSALNNKDFKFLLLSQSISDFGDWFVIPIYAALVGYTWGLGNFELALVAICMALPSVLVGLISGSIVERMPSRETMIVCDVIRSFCAFLLIFVVNYYFLLCLIIIESIARTFFVPAKQIFIKENILEDNLLSANSLSSVINQMAKIISPALGGIMICYWQYETIFFINSITFVISALLIMCIKKRSFYLDTSNIKILQSAKEGIHFVKHNFFIKHIILIIGIRFGIIFLYDAFFVSLTKEKNMTSVHYGLLLSMIALGSLIGAPLVNHFNLTKKHIFSFMSFGQLIGGLIIITMLALPSTNQWNVPFLLMWVFFGITNAFINIPYTTALQKYVHHGMVGRVVSISESIQNFFMIVSPMVGYGIMYFCTAKILFLASGCFLFLSGFYFILFKSFHKIEKK